MKETTKPLFSGIPNVWGGWRGKGWCWREDGEEIEHWRTLLLRQRVLRQATTWPLRIIYKTSLKLLLFPKTHFPAIAKVTSCKHNRTRSFHFKPSFSFSLFFFFHSTVLPRCKGLVALRVLFLHAFGVHCNLLHPHDLWDVKQKEWQLENCPQWTP